jgi:hypothetical protein
MREAREMTKATSKPLSEHALAELGNIIRKPEPAVGINPGVRKKLLTEGLAEVVHLPSPFAVHKGGNTQFLKATPAGVARWLEEER